MSRPARILCAVDFSRPAQAAFDRALALSRDGNAELTVVHAVPVDERFTWQARQRITRTAALRRAADLADVRLRVSEQHGDPADVILLHAHAGRFDRIVLGIHARTDVAGLRTGSIAERVARRAGCPVLIVPMSDERRESVAPLFRNILCPVDFTAGSASACRHALQLVEGGGRVTLLHVSRTAHPGVSRHRGDVSIADAACRLTQDVWQRMQYVVPVEARTETDVRVRVVSGSPTTEIVRIAAAIDADLVVMGVAPRDARRRTLTHSTATHVIRVAGRPVLAVPAGIVEPSGREMEADLLERPAA